MSAEAAMYRKAAVLTGVVLAALAVVAAVVGLAVDDARGMWAALVGVAIAALAGLTTQLVMVVGHRMQVASMAALVMGSWLVKMIVIVDALVALRAVEDFPRGLAGAFLMAGIVATLAVDVWVVQRGRVPYVQPSSKNDSE